MLREEACGRETKAALGLQIELVAKKGSLPPADSPWPASSPSVGRAALPPQEQMREQDSSGGGVELQPAANDSGRVQPQFWVPQAQSRPWEQSSDERRKWQE